MYLFYRYSGFKVSWTILATTLACASCGAGASSEAPAVPDPEAEEAAAAAFAQNVCETGDTIRDTVALREKAAREVSWRAEGSSAKEEELAHLKLLGFNDFHGQLIAGKFVEDRPVGSAAVLAQYFREASRGVESSTLIVHAGDLVGASPPVSALNRDEPVVEFLNRLTRGSCQWGEDLVFTCNMLTAMGNHELDEGREELMRLLQGGPHPDGKPPIESYEGARFPMLASNVVDAATDTPFLPPYLIWKNNELQIGFVGAMLQDAARYLMPSGISSIRFENEATSIQNAVNELKSRGVRAIVLVLHQGGIQDWGNDEGASNSLKGAISEIVRSLDKEVDVVISGHTHSPLNILVPNAGGSKVLVTQAFSAGTAFSNIDLKIDKATGDVVRKSARIVTTWADAESGVGEDVETARWVDTLKDTVSSRTSVVITEAKAPFPKNANCDGESAIGNLIADAQRWALNADAAFIQPSWIRSGLPSGNITWGDLFSVQPFGNRIVRVEMTGRQIGELLNEQWKDERSSRILSVSGINFVWNPAKPPEKRIEEIWIQGEPLVLDTKYVVGINEFLAQGGELFETFKKAKRLKGSTLDIDALTTYLRTIREPISPRIEGRVRRVGK